MSVCDTDDGEVRKTTSLAQGLDNMINVYKTDDGKIQDSFRLAVSVQHTPRPLFPPSIWRRLYHPGYNQLPNLRYIQVVEDQRQTLPPALPPLLLSKITRVQFPLVG